MARNTTPKKRPASRTLSANVTTDDGTLGRSTTASGVLQTGAPSEALNDEGGATTDDGATKRRRVDRSDEGQAQDEPASALPAHMKPLAKRSNVVAAPNTPTRTTTTTTTTGTGNNSPSASESEASEPNGSAKSKKALKRQREKARKKAAAAAAAAVAATHGSEGDSSHVQGDFADLFVIDTTPSRVPRDMQVEQGPETAADEDDNTVNVDKFSLEADRIAEQVRQGQDEQEQAFPDEVYIPSSSSGSSSVDTEDELDAGTGTDGHEDDEVITDELKRTIVDDSAAKVTGRYYKEADLTKSCALCGERGHSSRDCTHSQCFVCGAIDSEHEARNCPVSLICSGCGSRGHLARDCPIASSVHRYQPPRCSLCPSTLHMTVNCPSLWRIYDKTGAKPTKRKIVFACGNDGSTGDHFIDDCLLPRGHPMRLADPSAFNRAALGDAAANLPPASLVRGPPTGSARSRRRLDPGGRRGGHDQEADEDSGGDDDWFASRTRSRPDELGSASRNTGRGGNRGRERDSGNRGRDNGGSNDNSVGRRGSQKPYRGGKFSQKRFEPRGTHIVFRDGDGDGDRFRGSPSGSDRGWGSREDRRGADHFNGSPYGGGAGGSRDRRDRDSDRGSRRDGGGGSSLASRMSRPGPRYQGGYY